MFYMGYCYLCNFLDADLNADTLYNFLHDHQLAKHGKAGDIHILRVFMPWSTWLAVRRSPRFWEAWRHRKQPEYVVGRLEELRTS